jgi:hypothetical protein
MLLVTMVAAAAMTLPRHVPASWSTGLAATNVAVNTIR